MRYRPTRQFARLCFSGARASNWQTRTLLSTKTRAVMEQAAGALQPPCVPSPYGSVSLKKNGSIETATGVTPSVRNSWWVVKFALRW